MKHLKEFKIFEDVIITPSKKSELMPLMKKYLQNEVNELISDDYSKNVHGAGEIKKLIEVVKDNSDLDLKKILDGLNKKIANSAIPELTYKTITTGTEPNEALNIITSSLEDVVKNIVSSIPWAKRKLIGAAMRLKHPTKSSFIKNLKDPRLKDYKYAEESGYTFHFYRYRRAIKSLLTCGAPPFISKEDYFISSDKKDKSRQNYNKFYDSIDTPSFQKKIEDSFDKILNIVWEGI